MPQPRTIFQAGLTPNTNAKARRHSRKLEGAALLVKRTVVVFCISIQTSNFNQTRTLMILNQVVCVAGWWSSRLSSPVWWGP